MKVSVFEKLTDGVNHFFADEILLKNLRVVFYVLPGSH